MPELKGKTADGAVNWTYTGDVVDGKRHGKGKCIYDNDDVYDGEWQNDQWHGVGELTTEYDYHASVRKYKGHFANGQLHGTGIGHKSSVLFANNYSDSYEGEWRNGRPEGKGTMKSAAGSIQGEWEGNVPKAGANMTIFTSDGAEYYNGGLTSELHFAGFGRVTKRDGQESQTITCTDWFCNKPTGTGTWDCKDAEVDFHFKGELNDDKSKGHAHIKNFNEDGSVKEEFEYDGELFYFNPHGVGRRVFVDGRVEEGKFTHGDFQP